MTAAHRVPESCRKKGVKANLDKKQEESEYSTGIMDDMKKHGSTEVRRNLSCIPRAVTLQGNS